MPAENAPAEVAENDVPANAETDDAALAIVARENADEAGTDEVDESETAKLIDEALEKIDDENVAASGNVAVDSAEISAGTDFTIFGRTFHVDPTKTHAPLVEPASSAPAVDKRVRLVLGNSAGTTSAAKTQTTTKADDDDEALANATAKTLTGTMILSTNSTGTTFAGTVNTNAATRAFFSTASISSYAGTQDYSDSTGTEVVTTGTEVVTYGDSNDDSSPSATMNDKNRITLTTNGKTYEVTGTDKWSSVESSSINIDYSEAYTVSAGNHISILKSDASSLKKSWAISFILNVGPLGDDDSLIASEDGLVALTDSADGSGDNSDSEENQVLLSCGVSQDSNPTGYQFRYGWEVNDGLSISGIFLVDENGKELLRNTYLIPNNWMDGENIVYLGYAACSETTGFFFIQSKNELVTTDVLATGDDAVLTDEAQLWAKDVSPGTKADPNSVADFDYIEVYSAGYFSFIPEPSLFGLFAGTLALGLAGTRRRRKSR